jgi:hypothetical protein
VCIWIGLVRLHEIDRATHGRETPNSGGVEVRSPPILDGRSDCLGRPAYPCCDPPPRSYRQHRTCWGPAPPYGPTGLWLPSALAVSSSSDRERRRRCPRPPPPSRGPFMVAGTCSVACRHRASRRARWLCNDRRWLLAYSRRPPLVCGRLHGHGRSPKRTNLRFPKV